jgi:hypothetical protein
MIGALLSVDSIGNQPAKRMYQWPQFFHVAHPVVLHLFLLLLLFLVGGGKKRA